MGHWDFVVYQGSSHGAYPDPSNREAGQFRLVIDCEPLIYIGLLCHWGFAKHRQVSSSVSFLPG